MWQTGPGLKSSSLSGPFVIRTAQMDVNCSPISSSELHFQYVKLCVEESSLLSFSFIFGSEPCKKELDQHFLGP